MDSGVSEVVGARARVSVSVDGLVDSWIDKKQEASSRRCLLLLGIYPISQPYSPCVILVQSVSRPPHLHTPTHTKDKAFLNRFHRFPINQDVSQCHLCKIDEENYIYKKKKGWLMQVFWCLVHFVSPKP